MSSVQQQDACHVVNQDQLPTQHAQLYTLWLDMQHTMACHKHTQMAVLAQVLSRFSLLPPELTPVIPQYFAAPKENKVIVAEAVTKDEGVQQSSSHDQSFSSVTAACRG